MEFEELIVVFVVFGSALAAIKLILDFAKEKNRAKTSGGSSMTTSELKSVMREAIEEAVDHRLERLEKRLEHLEEPRLLASRTTHREELEAPPAPPVARDRDSTR